MAEPAPRASRSTEAGLPPLGRPSVAILLGAALSATLALLRAEDNGRLGRLFEDGYVVAAPLLVAYALALRARIPEHQALDYRRLSLCVVFIGAGMAVLDAGPALGVPLTAAGANLLFAVGGTISLTVVMPALYRTMDRRVVTMALVDGGIMMSTGTTLALTVWQTNQDGRPIQLLMPVVAAGVVASAGMALIAALDSRTAPTLGGVWAATPAVAVLGLAWVLLLDSLMRGELRNAATSVAFTAGILLIGHGWITWTDEVTDDERYSQLADELSDWLPIAAIVVCVAADTVPHGHIGGIDVIWLGTLGVVVCSIVRQRMLVKRERDASRHLMGEELLRAEKEAAESANRAKSAFLAMMSHEIRTPMNAILGNAALLGTAELGPAERESVEAIETAGDTLMSVINDVLDFSKIEADRMELERVGFAPANLIHSVASLFSVTARERGLRLVSEVDPSIPVILAGDPHRLHQVLSNLVGNAIKFTAEGGVTISARVIERTPGETRLRFAVVDTGIGIDEAARDRLFAPFVQLDASTTRRFGGSGLGLAICKRLVGLMGGEIAVESVPGEGSTFWFTALLSTPTDLEAGAVLEANEYVDRTFDLFGARVLVAEDNPANVRLIERMLGRLGVDSVCVGTGSAAVRAVRESIYDLVLMDLHMPEMDGLTATRAIRAAGHDIPIVALTADAQVSDRQACIAAGMNDYLSKPVRSADLEAALHRWLQGRDGRDADVGTVDAKGTIPDGLDDVIDRSQVGELLALDPDGSAGFLAAMVESYHDTLAETMPRIRAATDGSDWPALEEAAHKLKGVAANMGLQRVHEAAAKLVAGVRLGDCSDAGPTLAALEAALAPAASALEALLAQVPDPAGRFDRDAA